MAYPVFPSAQAAAGTLFQVSGGGCPEGFETVARITDISGPQIVIANIKTTSHSTVPAGGGVVFDTFIPTITDPGKIAAKIFIKTDQAQDRRLAGYALNHTLLDFRIVEPDSLLTIIQGTAFFTSYKLGHPVAGAVEANIEMQCSGPIYVYE
jgi:hypothetical protein